MALIDAESRPCAVMLRASVDDGEGGQVTKYMRGAKFPAVVSDGSNASQFSKKTLGNTDVSAKRFKFFYPTRISLKLNDVIVTEDNEKVYRVIAAETIPAKSASVQYSLVTAEEWELPT